MYDSGAVGRPPKKPEDRRTSQIHVPATGAEKDELEWAAGEDGKKLATWLREMGLRRAARLRRDRKRST